ncbi:MAG TPA: head GIN domain-containing protein [Lacibacter sp.]|nr:head GIN domain-containing protein [Lacibacter sp.]HMO87526.1 head GIN domain-containing protein [Lacibacter sp.]HMP87935.1 head GIN domain-containing protein [Lacibacter sp.]
MKQLCVVLLSQVFFFATSLAQDVLVVKDPNAELRPVGGYTGIHVSHAIDVIIKQGKEQAVVVSAAEPKVRDRIRTEVKDGVLRIWYDPATTMRWNRDATRLRAYVSVTEIRSLYATGASNIKVDGILRGEELKLGLHGASSFKGEVAYNQLNAEQTGASDAHIRGRVANLVVVVSGASDFKGYELVTDLCRATASGASDIKITVNKDLKATASGASDIGFRGEGVLSEFRTSGSGSVRKREQR